MSNGLVSSIREFEKEDFEVLKAFISCRERLHAAGLAHKVAAQRCELPIKTERELLGAVFDGPGSFLILAGHRLSYEDARTYLTPDLFPIEDIQDLAAKILLAFDRQDAVASARATIESFEKLSLIRFAEDVD